MSKLYDMMADDRDSWERIAKRLEVENVKLTASVKEERLVYQRMLDEEFKLRSINAELLAACEAAEKYINEAEYESNGSKCLAVIEAAIEKAKQ